MQNNPILTIEQVHHRWWLHSPPSNLYSPSIEEDSPVSHQLSHNEPEIALRKLEENMKYWPSSTRLALTHQLNKMRAFPPTINAPHRVVAPGRRAGSGRPGHIGQI